MGIFMKAMTASSTSDAGQDREARLRFMHITEETGALLREFWKIVEPALPKNAGRIGK